MKIVLKIEIMKNKFFKKYHFLSDLKIPENIPQYLKKAITVFNELMTDLRSISIQYENKINGLYALFVALERVNMRYIEKMKSRNNNPQTAKQQLKARLQICKNMKQVLKNTKKHEDVLTDEQKNLLPNSCNIDPLKPLSKNLTELTNPYFEKPPTKQAKIPDLLTEEKSTLKFKKDKLSKISSSPDTTVSPKDIPQPSQDTVQSSGEKSSTSSSAILKRVHPWCKLSKAEKETKDESTQKMYPAKQKPSVESTNTSQRSLISSNSPKTEDTEDTDNTTKGTKQKGKKEINKNESFLSSLKITIQNRNLTLSTHSENAIIHP